MKRENRQADDLSWPAKCTRVVIVATRLFEASGGSTFVRNFATALLEQGIEVELISVYPGSVDDSLPTTTVLRREALHRTASVRDDRGRVRLARLPIFVFKRFDRWRGLRRFKRQIDAYGDDTVVVFTHVFPRTLLRLSGYRRRAGGALLVGQHHSSYEGLWSEPWLREALPREFGHDDGFTALSSEDAELFENLIGIPCFAIPNPTSPVARVLPQPDREDTVVALARYSGEKQIEMMMRIFVSATADPALRHWRLRIYGEGNHREILEAERSRLEGRERVHLMGRTDEVDRVLESARLNILTSRFEGFPMSVLEAAQHGVPSMVFDCSPGVRELLGALDGYLVTPANDEVAFETALKLALEDSAQLKERGDFARSAVRRFEPEAVLRKWAEMIERIHRSR